MNSGGAEMENMTRRPIEKNESEWLYLFLNNELLHDTIDLHLWPLKALLQALQNECTSRDSVAGNLAAAMVPIVEKACEAIHNSLDLVESKIGTIKTVTVIRENKTYPKDHCWVEIVSRDGQVTSFGKDEKNHQLGI